MLAADAVAAISIHPDRTADRIELEQGFPGCSRRSWQISKVRDAKIKDAQGPFLLGE
jgi:hypothetical protein